MALKSIDQQHFYLDNKLIDLVWIAHQVKKQTNAANYHKMNRGLNWLNVCLWAKPTRPTNISPEKG